MKVAWVSTYDAADPNAFQGRGYFAPLSLRRQAVDVQYVGPFQTPLHLKLYRKLVSVATDLRYNNRCKKPSEVRRYAKEHAPFVYKSYARQIARTLAGSPDVDVVCCGVNPGSLPISYLDCDQPIVIWTDSTWASAIDFYPQYMRNSISAASANNIVKNEKAALSRCRLAIYWSEWGAKNAIEQYHFDPQKVKVVPAGGISECDRTLEDVMALVESRPKDQCRLLFAGVDWDRKGGDIAYRVASELNQAGMPTELTVVGCEPLIDGPIPSFVRPLGYISNATAEGKAKLNALFGSAHFFIMPSRAESYGYVFCEANSFGVPCIGSNVGGIPTIIKHDRNGRTFSKETPINDYCSYIANTMKHYDSYKQLAVSSFNEYEARLNWKTAGSVVKGLLQEMVTECQPARAN